MQELPKIARERLAAGPVSSPHLDANLISAFAVHALLADERQRVIAHMAVCEDCRAEVQLVISAMWPGARATEAVRDLTPESASRFSWQRLLRWRPMAAAAGVLAISVAFWVATRQPASRGVHPAASVNLASKAEPPSSPAASAGATAARSQVPAPSGEAKQTLTRALPSSHENAVASNSEMTKGLGRDAASEVSGQLVSGKAQSPEQRETEVRPTGALAVAAPPPPAPVPASPEANRASAPPAVQPASAQAASTSIEAAAAPARGVQGAPTFLSLQKNLAAPSALAPRRMAQLATQPGVRWAVSGDATSGQPIPGAVQKSLDGGGTWQPVPVAPGVTFRVVFALGRDVWAGGVAGAFYHSSDDGEHWSAVSLATSGGTAAGNIVSIQFADASHGVVRTSSGQTWTTSDGGTTWQLK